MKRVLAPIAVAASLIACAPPQSRDLTYSEWDHVQDEIDSFSRLIDWMRSLEDEMDTLWSTDGGGIKRNQILWKEYEGVKERLQIMLNANKVRAGVTRRAGHPNALAYARGVGSRTSFDDYIVIEGDEECDEDDFCLNPHVNSFVPFLAHELIHYIFGSHPEGVSSDFMNTAEGILQYRDSAYLASNVTFLAAVEWEGMCEPEDLMNQVYYDPELNANSPLPNSVILNQLDGYLDEDGFYSYLVNRLAVDGYGFSSLPAFGVQPRDLRPLIEAYPEIEACFQDSLRIMRDFVVSERSY